MNVDAVLRVSKPNGVHDKTIYFREVDDTYHTIVDTTVILVNQLNIKLFYELYDKYRIDHNIIIDSRLEWLIIYGYLKYEIEILIYNIVNNTVINIFSWCLNKMSIAKNEINIEYVKKLLLLYLIVNFYLKNCRIVWNVSDATSSIKKCVNTNHFITLDYIITYIDDNSSIKNSDNFAVLTKLFTDVLKFTNIENIQPFGRYDMSDIQNTLRYLQLNSFTLF